MSPIAHFMASWLVAAVTTDNPRDRKLVTLAGVLPDGDGLGLVIDVAKGLISGGQIHYHYYQRYHHYLLHGWPGSLLVSAMLACFARRRVWTLVLCLLTFHLHLFCDLLGSRGPEPGDFWPIAYSEPLFRRPVWIWSHQWRLDGWQNQLIFAALFLTALWLAAKKGYSFLEFFGQRLDAIFVAMIRRWRAGLSGKKSTINVAETR